MSELVYIGNSAAVGLFGMILSISFCDILWTKKNRVSVAVYLAFLLLVQAIIYSVSGADMVTIMYPMITHIPLGLFLAAISKKYLWPFVAVLTSYLCCQLRRWLALFVTAFIAGNTELQAIVELVITIPLLFVLLKYIAPYVRFISHYTLVEQWRFGVIPLLCYGFDYLTRIYTDWLNEGTPVVVEFMFFICSALYLILVVHSSKEEKKRIQMEQIEGYLRLQVAQSVRDIEDLRKSQEKINIYRHDLRHHMLYLLSCIENGRLEEAQEYIQEVCSEIETSKVNRFCENESLNLVFSGFVGKAEERGIPIEVNVAIASTTSVKEMDLCVLLSNALDNALHACETLKEKGLPASIEISGFEKNNKLFFEISNSCDNNIRFEKGIPITHVLGHGIGVRSICAIVEKYGGMHAFIVKENRFVLRVSL